MSKHHALCGQHELLHHWGADLWTLWQMRGGEEGGDGLGQVQEDPLWILLHRVRSHKYESWSHLHQLHGFKPFRFYLREDAEHAVRFINGTRLDDRIIRCVVCLIEIIPLSLLHCKLKYCKLGLFRTDWDAGFVEGRQYGRGKTGGQVQLLRIKSLNWLFHFRWGMSTGLISTPAEGDTARSSSRSWKRQMASCEISVHFVKFLSPQVSKTWAGL